MGLIGATYQFWHGGRNLHCFTFRMVGGSNPWLIKNNVDNFLTHEKDANKTKTILSKPWKWTCCPQSVFPSHVMECQDKIEGHANHRPGHYKENVHPLIYGLFSRWGSSWCGGGASTQRFFSREVRDALAKYLRSLLVPCFPLPDRWLFPVSCSYHHNSQKIW